MDIPFVSTSLDWFLADEHKLDRDVTIGDMVFRRLSGDYLGWLQGRVKLAADAVADGKLDVPTYQDVERKLCDIMAAAPEITPPPRLSPRYSPPRYEPPLRSFEPEWPPPCDPIKPVAAPEPEAKVYKRPRVRKL